jgi:protein-S-isoprenylcysteine O-methyltransferase Ste14
MRTPDKLNLLVSALVKYIFGVALVALMLFLPAGDFVYPNAWLFMALLFLPMLIVGVWLYVANPALLASRLKNKEQRMEQKHVVALSGIIFISVFVLCGLDYRYDWSQVPRWIICVASVLLLVGYAMYAEVMRENTYLSRTIEVQEGQQLIDTGMYAVVRHPMYSATIIMYMAIPLVLGSLWALILMLFYPLVIVIRIQNEEQLLVQELPGYREYQKRVKYKIIPGIW